MGGKRVFILSRFIYVIFLSFLIFLNGKLYFKYNFMKRKKNTFLENVDTYKNFYY